MRIVWSWLVFLAAAAITALLIGQGVVEGDAADLDPGLDTPTVTLLLVAAAIAALLTAASFFVALVGTLRAAARQE